MILLGIDYGTKYLGLAIASSPLAEPLKTLKVSSKILGQILQICERLQVERIVVGISEGRMARETEDFVHQLAKIVKIPIVLQDETLTSQLAIQHLKEAHAKKRKIQGPDHSFAATLILQEYLDQDPKYSK